MTPSLAPPTKRKASALSPPPLSPSHNNAHHPPSTRAPPPTTSKPDPGKKKEEDEEEEEDYLSMPLPSLTKPLLREKETYTARRQRLAREAEAKQPKSRAEREAAARAAREEALSKPLYVAQPEGKGLKMMQRMGFKEGGLLGKSNPTTSPDTTTTGELVSEMVTSDARAEPIGIHVKEGRGGIGLDAEKARVFREKVRGVERKEIEEVEGYRERVAREREEKRFEGLWWAAMGVAEGLEESREEGAEGLDDEDAEEGGVKEERKKMLDQRPLRSVPLLWRALKRRRLEQAQGYRERHSLPQLSSTTSSVKVNARQLNTLHPEDNDGNKASGSGSLRPLTNRSPPSSPSTSPPPTTNPHLSNALLAEADLEDPDPELEAYSLIPVSERFEELVRELRKRWWYCFWCKMGYGDPGLEGCPGEGEDVHG